MLSFEPYPVSYMVLTFWGSLHNTIESLKGCFPMLLDYLVSRLYGFIIGDGHWFFCCTWMIPQENFMQAMLCGHIQPSIVYKSHDGEPCIPIILSC